MLGSIQAEANQHLKIDKDILDLISKKPWTKEHSHCLATYAQFSQHVPVGARVIEFGCGDGWLVGLLASRGCTCTGVDINLEWLRMASVNWPKVNFIHGDWSLRTWYNGPYNVVIWNGALHHSLNIKEALAVSWHNTIPGGQLLCCEPGFGHSLMPFTKAWHKKTGVTERDTPPLKIIAAGYLIGWRNPLVYPMMSMLLKVNHSIVLSSLVALGKFGHGFTKMTKPL